MKNYFQGYYFKHQKEEETLCLIAGRSDSSCFIQIITQDGSWQAPMEGCRFSSRGVSLNIDTANLVLKGKINYYDRSPIRYDIMGPFAHFPMECRHSVISMTSADRLCQHERAND